jgi:hypothetical protein
VQSGKSVRKKKKGGIMTVGIVVVVIVVAVVIGVAVGMKQRNINNQLLSEGRMIKRDIDFMEKNYFYTSRIATYKQIYEKLDSSDLSGTGVSWSGKIGDIIFKSSLGWSARLAEVESDDENHKYLFHFTNWETYRGLPQNTTSMNVLLTAVEKCILSVDPTTKVTTTEMKLKTKSHFL